MRANLSLVSYDDFIDFFLAGAPSERDLQDEVATAGLATRLTPTPPTGTFQNLLAFLNQSWLLPDDIAIVHQTLIYQRTPALAGLYRRSEAKRVSKYTQWSYVDLLIEYTTDSSEDPFAQEPRPPRRRCDSDSGLEEEDHVEPEDIVECILSDATAVFNSQHRTHLFTLLIFSTTARFICWDRAGYVVSEPFDYTSEPWKLILFLWCFARMSSEQRGHDTTVTRIPHGSADYELLKKRAMPPKDAMEGRTAVPGDHAQVLFENSVRNDTCWRVRVDDTQKGSRYFLVGMPHYCAPGLAGRGTRTFVAVDAQDPYGPLVYLKDVWRVVHTGVEQEGKILEHLNSDDNGGPVPYVPTVRFHGDVENQVTWSHAVRLEQDKDRKKYQCPSNIHRHYRLVVNEIGRPLSLFKNMKGLIGLVTLCLQAHGEAYTRKKLIHQDISAGNVLIYPEYVCGANGVVTEKLKPLLADWDMAKRIDDSKEAPRQLDRTGTWQFMSASALSQPSKRIIVQDDVESFFHLVLYYAIRFIPHNCLNVGNFMEMYFDGHVEENGIYYGGFDKFNSMVNGELTTPRGIPLFFHVTEEAIESPPSSSTMVPLPTALSIAHSSDATSHPPPQTLRSNPTTNRENASDSHRRVVHPVTKLLEDFLLRLKAHYSLYVTQKSTDSSSHKLSLVKKATDVDSAVTSLRKKREPPVKQPLKVLSPAERAELEILASKLADHSEMIDLFAEHYEEGDWPDEDRCPDQLPEDYKPDYDRAFVTVGSKRPAGSAFGTSVHQAGRSRISGV
ncbi:hypothetical protein C8Q73DRAFT_707508 [Cubamyces lactineus]|nr:hypothetical protein C8Q73DRAFT_707508 [Cubamyces lactineus]